MVKSSRNNGGRGKMHGCVLRMEERWEERAAVAFCTVSLSSSVFGLNLESRVISPHHCRFLARTDNDVTVHSLPVTATNRQ